MGKHMYRMEECADADVPVSVASVLWKERRVVAALRANGWDIRLSHYLDNKEKVDWIVMPRGRILPWQVRVQFTENLLDFKKATTFTEVQEKIPWDGISLYFESGRSSWSGYSFGSPEIQREFEKILACIVSRKPAMRTIWMARIGLPGEGFIVKTMDRYLGELMYLADLKRSRAYRIGGRITELTRDGRSFFVETAGGIRFRGRFSDVLTPALRRRLVTWADRWPGRPLPDSGRQVSFIPILPDHPRMSQAILIHGARRAYPDSPESAESAGGLFLGSE